MILFGIDINKKELFACLVLIYVLFDLLVFLFNGIKNTGNNGCATDDWLGGPFLLNNSKKPAVCSENVETEGVNTGLLQAVHFELLWLQNKRDHYRLIELEDEKRISMLEERWRVLGQ